MCSLDSSSLDTIYHCVQTLIDRPTMSSKKNISELSPLSNPHSPRKSDPIISELFSPEFLSHLKNELNQKVKSSKVIDDGVSNVLATNKKYEREIHDLHSKLRKLKIENEQLRRTLELVSSNLNLQGSEEELKAQLKSLKHADEFKICPIEILSIRGQDNQPLQEEITLLRQKVKFLQEYKVMKEKRFNEMIAKGTIYVEEINMLKYKNEQLEDTVKKIKSGIGMLGTAERPMFIESIEMGNADKVFKKQQENGKQTLTFAANPSWNDSLININLNSLSPNMSAQSSQRSTDMVISHTMNIELPNEFDINHVQKVKPPQIYDRYQHNQIDYLIGEEIPYVQVSSSGEISRDQAKQPTINVNQSVVTINLNPII